MTRTIRHYVVLLLMIVAVSPALAEDPLGIAAVVDDQAISSLDIQERTTLMLGLANLPDTPESRAKLQPQVLRQLIDEKLQMRDAEQNGIVIDAAKLEDGYAQIEAQSGKAPGSLIAYLQSQGLPKTSMDAQVRAQMAWSEIVLRKIRPRVRISDQEVLRYAARMAEGQTSSSDTSNPEVYISVVQIDGERAETEAKALVEGISKGGDFRTLAAAYGGAGEPFWVPLAQMDPAIAAALAKTAKGGVTQPVENETGYQVVQLLDTRRGAPKASPLQESEGPRYELTFKQIIVAPKQGTVPEQREQLVSRAQQLSRAPGACVSAEVPAAASMPDVNVKAVPMRALSQKLPEKLKDALVSIKVGDVSRPYVTPQGVRIFMLCERIDLPASTAATAVATLIPRDDDAARQALFREKVELEAQKYLRNLRREAYIDVRMR